MFLYYHVNKLEAHQLSVDEALKNDTDLEGSPRQIDRNQDARYPYLFFITYRSPDFWSKGK